MRGAKIIDHPKQGAPRRDMTEPSENERQLGPRKNASEDTASSSEIPVTKTGRNERTRLEITRRGWSHRK